MIVKQQVDGLSKGHLTRLAWHLAEWCIHHLALAHRLLVAVHLEPDKAAHPVFPLHILQRSSSGPAELQVVLAEEVVVRVLVDRPNSLAISPWKAL